MESLTLLNFAKRKMKVKRIFEGIVGDKVPKW